MPMLRHTYSRRDLVLTLGSAGLASATALAGCATAAADADKVTPNEDLMREHSLIRRALFVYGEASRKARRQPDSLPLPSLHGTAKLFREFAEDYHERELEEAHIFPVVRSLKSPVAQLPDILQRQHQIGREITDYVIAVAGRSSLAPAEAERLATTLDSFVAMYGPHAAREDTDVFPAWKAALGGKRYDEMGEQFDTIEKRRFGGDGFEQALTRIERIEMAFGLDDLDRVTPPSPPQAPPPQAG